LSEAQSEVHPRHSATPISDEHRHASRASRGSAPAEPATRKRGHQDIDTEISSDTHHSANSDDNHIACDIGDEDPRPAKRRKPRAAPTATPTTCRRHTPELRLGQPGPLVALSTATPETDDAQPEADGGFSSTFIDDEQHRVSRTSRSPSAAAEAVPVAEYQEWPFQGLLKRTRIGDDVTYNLEFKLPSIDPKALDICSGRETPARVPTHHEAAPIRHEAATHSKIYPAALQPQIKRAPWTPKEDATLLKMRNEGYSWEDIHAALPHRSKGTIQVRYSTKLKK
jgi:hypothetical protein